MRGFCFLSEASKENVLFQFIYFIFYFFFSNPHIGTINYYHKSPQRLSTILVPLYKLSAKNERSNSSVEIEQVFCKSMELLTSATQLLHYDSTKKMVLACDAAPCRIDAVISHIMGDNEEESVVYTSHT